MCLHIKPKNHQKSRGDLNAKQASCSQTPIKGRILGPPLCRYQLVAELRRLLLHVLDLLLFVLHLVFVHAQRVILRLVLEHLVYRPRNGVRCCHRRLGWSQPGTQPPIQRPERTIRLLHRLRRHPKRLSRPILRLQRVIAQYFAPGDVMFGRQSQPPAEMLLGRKLLPDIAPHLHRHRLRSKRKVDVQWGLFALVHNIGKIHVFGALS